MRDAPQHVVALNGPPSGAVGSFYERALAIEDLPKRVAFLNRGHRWVVRKLETLLPRVRDEALHADLSDMLRAHSVNIARAEDFLRNSGAMS